MRKPIALMLLVSMLSLAVALTACKSDRTASPSEPTQSNAAQPTSQPHDPTTATLEQITEKTRTAMNEITSYQTSGPLIIETTSSNPDDGGTGEIFTTWKFPGRYRMVMEDSDPDTGNSQGTEILTIEVLTIGDRNLFVYPDSEWQEMAPIGPPSTLPGRMPLLNLLDDLNDITLISTSDTLTDGSNAYRLEIDDFWASSNDDDPQGVGAIKNRQSHYALVIDQQTFRFVSLVTINTHEIEAHGTLNGVANSEIVKVTQTSTYNFYNYNQPVEIEVPNEYKPWVDPRASTPRFSPQLWQS